jgi:hypothetical protein
MKDPIQPFMDNLTRNITDPDQKQMFKSELNKAKSQVSENKKHTDYLKNAEDLEMVMKFIKNKKLSNREIKSKIREFLNNPEEITDFLKALLKKVDTKKEESKEATASGAGVGAFVPPLTGGEYKPTTNVPTVRESKEVLKGGKADKKTLLDLAKKHAYDDSTDSTTKERINKVHKELKNQLTKGIKVELEHTNNKSKAEEIAMDHLSEDPKYYDKLKKVETKEMTTTTSSGQYSTNSIWAKSTKKKDWGPSRKTQIPGGKFVQVKKKCKKFPYCNQGDINALRIFENKSVQSVIETVSSKYGVDKVIISDIVFEEIRKTQK